jgi:DNA-binding MarR family transcriptional regulator
MTRSQRIALVNQAIRIADLNATCMEIITNVGISSEPLLVQDLALLGNVSPPCISRSCDALVAKKLVRRTRDKEDRRKVFISLTIQGERLLTNMVEFDQ